MRPNLLTIRYPNNDTEFRSTMVEPPEPGDFLHTRGVSWLVAQVTKAEDGTLVVTVVPEAPQVEHRATTIRALRAA